MKAHSFHFYVKVMFLYPQNPYIVCFHVNVNNNSNCRRFDNEKIAVLTSGGDAPGMNSAIRAVVRKRHFMELMLSELSMVMKA